MSNRYFSKQFIIAISSLYTFAFSISLCATEHKVPNKGKLLATAATSSLEGAAGGGIVPWAVLSGYDTRDQFSMAGFTTRVDVSDYRLDSYGVSTGFFDRIEISAAQQRFRLKASNTIIQQNIYGSKIRLLGDVVYSTYPQVSLGIQHKHLVDSTVASAVNASNSDHGTDFYWVASKLHLGALGGYNMLWSGGARYTKANQLGLLGFGGDKNNDYQWMFEGSAAVMPNRHVAIGIEYREKPDNLRFAVEDDWTDIFIAWFPNKHVNITAAWADLGSIAGVGNQQGWYLSITIYPR